MNTESGKVVFIGQTREGVNSRTGETWRAVDFVIETSERYPRKIAFGLFETGSSNRIAAAQLRQGETIDVIYYPESHDYNGRWYTELKCTDICQGGFSRFAQGQMFQQ